MKDLKQTNIGFIGYGNMASAIAKGLLRAKAVLPSQLHACARDYEKLCKNTKPDNIRPCKDAIELVSCCDVIFIGVKPYQVKDVLTAVKDKLTGKIIISLAAGIYHHDLEAFIPGTHYMATVPNTPVSVCEGVFVCEEQPTLTSEEKDFVQALLETIGIVVWIDQAHMDIASTISGCSPAFAAMFIEALGDAGCKHGLTRTAAYQLASQMLSGTGKMALESGKHPGQLKDAVCSPGGTTIVGVTTLEKNGFRHSVIDAIDQIQNKLKN